MRWFPLIVLCLVGCGSSVVKPTAKQVQTQQQVTLPDGTVQTVTPQKKADFEIRPAPRTKRPIN